MPFKVTAPLVCAPDMSGKVRYYYAEAVIPWLDDERAEHLLRLGLVEETDDEATPEAEATVGVQPKKTASQEAWAQYAVSAHGVDPTEAAQLSRQELIELYGDK